VTARALVSGAYPADRAAPFAGVPLRTLHYWAEIGLVVQSVSRTKLIRWFYADLLLAGLVDWFRQDKPPDLKIPRTSIRRIREMLERLITDARPGARLEHLRYPVDLGPAEDPHNGGPKWPCALQKSRDKVPLGIVVFVTALGVARWSGGFSCTSG